MTITARLFLPALLAGLLFTEGQAQDKKASPPPAGSPTVTLPTAPRTGPKTFQEVITDKAISHPGLFSVHKVDDKYYFEVADSLIGRVFMAITRISKTPTGAALVAPRSTARYCNGKKGRIINYCCAA